MRNYEVMYILRPELDQEAVEAAVARFQDIIGNGGTLTKHDLMGKRRLAYEINKFREGIYVLEKFEAGAEVITELDRVLKISDEVIRHIIVKDVA